MYLFVFNLANNISYTPEDLENRYYCFFLVSVYELNTPNSSSIIYSAINSALKGLQISHSTLFIIIIFINQR